MALAEAHVLAWQFGFPDLKTRLLNASATVGGRQRRESGLDASHRTTFRKAAENKHQQRCCN